MKQANEQLISLLKERKPEGFRYIYDVYYPVLCAVAFEYVKDEAWAQSLVEDVIIGIWEKKEGLEEILSLQAYLIRSVRNKCIDWLRGQEAKVRQRVSLDDEKYVNSGFMEEQDLFEHILLLELQEQITKAVDLLPEPCKQVFCMSRFENLSYEEIALQMYISVNTVKYHMKRALSLLREYLREFLPLALLLFAESLAK